MKKQTTEYQIFIGCRDPQIKDEIVSKDDLIEMVERFFQKRKIDFSMYSANGGFIYKDGTFVLENSLCINIIGAIDIDIVKLAKSLSMFMNQECSLVVKNCIKADFY